MSKPVPIEPKPDQESVWDYPRPPRLERTGKHVQVFFAEQLIADSQRAYRILETSHPPVYYIPPQDIRLEYLRETAGSSWCEWKGQAAYYDIVVGDRIAKHGAWYYQRPAPAFREIKGHVAFYAHAMDECRVDGEQVRPQPGGFYGGWITNDVVGPFKGGPGTQGW